MKLVGVGTRRENREVEEAELKGNVTKKVPDVTCLPLFWPANIMPPQFYTQWPQGPAQPPSLVWGRSQQHDAVSGVMITQHTALAPLHCTTHAVGTYIPQAFQTVEVAAVSGPPAGAANMEKGFLRSGKSQGNLLCGKFIGRYSWSSLEKRSHTFHFNKWKICGRTARLVGPFCALSGSTAMMKWCGVSLSKTRGPPLVKLCCLWP